MATKRDKHENANENYQEPITAKEEGQSINDGYSQLVRRPYENEHPSYTSLIGDQGRNKEKDNLSYVDVINENYSSLVRSPSHNYENEAPLYTALIKRTNEEADKLADTENNWKLAVSFKLS